jgi:hypothetical protein
VTVEINSYQLKEIQDIHRFFRSFRHHGPTGWWFRGHANVDWGLIPKAGRPEFYLRSTSDTTASRDLGRFVDWRKHAVAYLKDLPGNDWECLAVAQHHGLATRLLDWTLNPLVAVFFAAIEGPDNNAAVWCYDPDLYIKEEIQPIEFQGVGLGFLPRAISPRILNQRCAFTYHGPPDAEIVPIPHYVWKDHSNLAKLIIDKNLKPELLQLLDDYGINNSTLFPDLDGLSRYINWRTQTMVAGREKRPKPEAL